MIRSRNLILLLGLVVVAAVVLGVLLPGGTDSGRSSVRTIVLVTVDTLRRDRVGAHAPRDGAFRSLTPRMDRLARSGTRFDDARTPVPLTLPGHAVMLTGLPPAVIGIRVNGYGRLPDRADREFDLLQERLGDKGWRTGAFVSAAPLLALHGLDQGFDAYDDEGLDDAPPGFTYNERPGEDTVRRALAWTKQQARDDRVFLWVHLFEPHAPYAPELDPTLAADVRYDVDVVHADRIVGTLLDGLDALGRDEAVVLLTADHGESLEELGEATHGYLLSDATLRVPFMLAGAGVPTGAVREDPADLADVAPTLAALAGAPWTNARVSDGPGVGLDLLAGPVPVTRARIAESLYAHQRYRWAQLLCAIGPTGTLVDAGGERVLWLTPAPFGELQSDPRPVSGVVDVAEEAAVLGDALRTYRTGERQDLLRGGGAAGGYGSGAEVAPFLSTQENGRRANPYDAIPGVEALGRFGMSLDHIRRGHGTPGDARRILTRLERMDGADPTNPEIAYLRGRAWEELVRRAPDDREARREAAAAFLEAWQRGRQDANTLGKAVGIDAAGRKSDALALLQDLSGTIPPDGRLRLLKARILRALGRDDEADDACRDAAELLVRPWEKRAIEGAREDGSCR